MTARTCGGCRFCVAVPEQEGKGLCRCFPPDAFREVVVQETGSEELLHSRYRFVPLADVGCGEFKPPLGRIGRAFARCWAALACL